MSSMAKNGGRRARRALNRVLQLLPEAEREVERSGGEPVIA